MAQPRDKLGRFIVDHNNRFAKRQAAAMAGRQGRIKARIKWFDQKVESNIKIGMSSRIRIAAQLVRDQAVINVSRPVTKYRGPRSGRIQVDPSSRSKPGEFPKADTTRLMKDLFHQMDGVLAAIVGTTLDYGLLLETKMNRSYLRRTLHEMAPALRKILTTGRGGGRFIDFPGQDR